MQRTKSQNGRRSRDKGERFMREIVNAMQEAGIGCCKRSQYRGTVKDGPDIQDTDWWIECKVGSPKYLTDEAIRRMHADAVVEESKHNAPHLQYSPPVVVWKRARCEPMVTAFAEDIAWLVVNGDAPDAKPASKSMLATIRFADWLELVKPR